MTAYIYAMSSIPDEHTGERIRKGVILELDRPGLRDAVTEGGLEEMVLSDPQRFLELCNLRWVDPKEIPEAPKKNPARASQPFCSLTSLRDRHEYLSIAMQSWMAPWLLGLRS